MWAKGFFGRPDHFAIACWIDLLGYGAMIAEADFNPLHPRAAAALERLRRFHKIVADHSVRHFPTLVTNDGAVAYRDLSLRSRSPTHDFVLRAWRLFRSIQGTHDIMTELIASDAVLYNLKIPGYNPPGTMLHAAMEKGLVNLRAVMDQTGGEVFNVQDVSHLDETFRALIERIKTRYTLGYYTKASAAEGKPHKLDVRLAASFGKKGRDYVVLSKNGFYVH